MAERESPSTAMTSWHQLICLAHRRRRSMLSSKQSTTFFPLTPRP
jgi:hypothetical protein